MDFNTLLSLRQAWSSFKNNHPKFPGFINAVKARGICEGTELFISLTYPDGQTLKAGLKLKSSDIELYNSLQGLMRQQ